jgi:hypothetical protein
MLVEKSKTILLQEYANYCDLLFFFCKINKVLPFGICTQGLSVAYYPHSELCSCDGYIKALPLLQESDTCTHTQTHIHTGKYTHTAKSIE